jgi:8-oxo-dGTP diphosphatase
VTPGESPGEAAVREALEETGLTVRAGRIIGDRIHPDTGAHLIYVACEVVAGTARVAADAEVDAVQWVPIGKLAVFVPAGT